MTCVRLLLQLCIQKSWWWGSSPRSSFSGSRRAGRRGARPLLQSATDKIYSSNWLLVPLVDGTELSWLGWACAHLVPAKPTPRQIFAFSIQSVSQSLLSHKKCCCILPPSKREWERMQNIAKLCFPGKDCEYTHLRWNEKLVQYFNREWGIWSVIAKQ